MQGDVRSSLSDCLDAIALAEKNQDYGLAWSFLNTTAIPLMSVGQMSKAVEMLEKYVSTAEAAIAAGPDTIYPGTGGRERNPSTWAKVVDSQYRLALYFMKDKATYKQGRQHYLEALNKEASLPNELLGEVTANKIICQAMLTNAVPSTSTQAAINAGFSKKERGTKSLLECYACGTVSCPKLLFCSRCKKVAYCSSECQRVHWKAGHKHDCK